MSNFEGWNRSRSAGAYAACHSVFLRHEMYAALFLLLARFEHLYIIKSDAKFRILREVSGKSWKF
jgi:hypothetical protein